MTDIYNDFDRTTGTICAYAILHDGEYVARVVTKTSTALTAYVHWLGEPMQKGRAGGGGYDRQTAAVEIAAAKIGALDSTTGALFVSTLTDPKLDGRGWISRLENVGFRVCSVIA